MTTDMETRLDASREFLSSRADDGAPDYGDVVARVRKRSRRRVLAAVAATIGIVVVAGSAIFAVETQSADPIRVGSTPAAPASTRCALTDAEWAAAPFHPVMDSGSGGAVRGYVANPAEFDQHGFQPVYAQCDGSGGIIGYEIPDGSFLDQATYRERYGTADPTFSGAPIPSALKSWISDLTSPLGSGRAVSADWALTTSELVAPIMGETAGSGDVVYVVVFNGDFTWDHSCPAGASPSACVSHGKAAVYELTASDFRVIAFGLQAEAPNLSDLSKFNTSGHVDLSTP